MTFNMLNRSLRCLTTCLLLAVVPPASAVTGQITNFDPPGSPGRFLGISAINRQGSIAGYFIGLDCLYHGFVRDSSGNFTILDAPSAGKLYGEGTFAMGLNDAGQIVGYFNNSASGGISGFLRDPSGA